MTTLGTGATVVFPAGISGPEILDAVKQGRATALLAVPRLCTALWDGIATAVQARGAAAATTFQALLAASIALRRHSGLRVGRRLFAGVHARFGGTLELIGCGGAKLPAELAWQLEGLGFRVLTGYGLTETSPVLTFNSPRQSLLGSEGRPLPGVEVRIAGDSAETPGEILARGSSVFAGYWNDTAATAAAFTADGWFRTGDLGRFDDAGYLHVVGRSKELIVLADGKKFFPESVEKAYALSPLLKEIGVFERDGALAAVVVPNEDAIRARGALRETAALREAIEEAAARLPPYERITNYRVVRSALPRTQLGKLRRHLLPGLFAGGEQRLSAPATATEADRALLAAPLAGAVWRWLWARYPAQPLSLDTSPQLELGIDSLGWVALTAELERQFGVTLRAEQLARILTLRDLLREVGAAASGPDLPRAATAAFVEPGPALRLLGAVVLATVRLLVRLVFQPAIAGAERLPPGPAVMAPNHASYLDPLVLVAALPWRRLRHTYWAGWVGVMHTTRLRRLLSRAAQVFPVDPDRDLAASVRTAQQLLERGHTIVWFPEGRRSPDGRLQKFQSGVTMLLQHKPVSIVPTAITGTFAAWPKHRRWPRRAPIEVVFGTPLALGAERDAQVLLGKLEVAVKDLLPSANRVPANRVPELRSNRSAGVTVEPNRNTGTGGVGAGVTGVDAMPTPSPIEVTLRDGRAVAIRPIQRDDSARTAAFLDGLSEDSKHALFLGCVAHVSEAELHRLCEPTAGRDMAYIATAADADGRVREVGLCRYAGADSVTGAEISVAVADAWQHQGLGKMLLHALIEHARSNGVRRLYSTDSAGNAAMRRLAHDMGFSEERDPDDIHQVIYSLRMSRTTQPL